MTGSHDRINNIGANAFRYFHQTTDQTEIDWRIGDHVKGVQRLPAPLREVQSASGKNAENT